MTPAYNQSLNCTGKTGFVGWCESSKLTTLRAAWFDAPDLAAQQKLARRDPTAIPPRRPLRPHGAIPTTHRLPHPSHRHDQRLSNPLLRPPQMTPTEYTALDATAIATLIRTKQVSAEEVLTAAAERIESLNPTLNAVPHPFIDQGRAAIRAGLPEGPFTGVPFLIKNTGAAVANTPLTTGSSPVPRRHNSPPDGTLAKRWRAGGVSPDRQDQHPRTRHELHHRAPRLRPHPQPLEPRPQPRRQQRRLGGRRRRRHGPHGARLGRRRVDPPALPPIAACSA